jgi:hypothetical protein
MSSITEINIITAENNLNEKQSTSNEKTIKPKGRKAKSNQNDDSVVADTKKITKTKVKILENNESLENDEVSTSGDASKSIKPKGRKTKNIQLNNDTNLLENIKDKVLTSNSDLLENNEFSSPGLKPELEDASKPIKTKGRKTKTILTDDNIDPQKIATTESLENKKSIKSKGKKTKNVQSNTDDKISVPTTEQSLQNTDDKTLVLNTEHTLENNNKVLVPNTDQLLENTDGKLKKTKVKKTKLKIDEPSMKNDVFPEDLLEDNPTQLKSNMPFDEPVLTSANTIVLPIENNDEDNELQKQLDDAKKQWSIITSKLSILNNDKETLELQQKQLLAILVGLIEKNKGDNTEIIHTTNTAHLGLLSNGSSVFSDNKMQSTLSHKSNNDKLLKVSQSNSTKSKIISVESDVSSESDSESSDSDKQPLIITKGKKMQQILKTNSVISSAEYKIDSESSSESDDSSESNKNKLITKSKHQIIKKKGKTPLIKTTKIVQSESSSDSDSD